MHLSIGSHHHHHLDYHHYHFDYHHRHHLDYYHHHHCGMLRVIQNVRTPWFRTIPRLPYCHNYNHCPHDFYHQHHHLISLGHTDTVLTVRWGEGDEGREEGGRTLVSAGKDKTIRIWDIRAGR